VTGSETQATGTRTTCYRSPNHLLPGQRVHRAVHAVWLGCRAWPQCRYQRQL